MKEEMIKEKYKLSTLIKHLYEYLGEHKKDFWIGTFFRGTNIVAGLFTGYALGEIVTDLSHLDAPHIRHSIIIMGLWWIISIIRPFFDRIGKVRLFSLAEKTEKRVELSMIRNLIAKEGVWHESENTGTKIKRIINGAESITKLIRIWTKNILDVLITSVGVLLIVSFEDIFLGVSAILFIVSFSLLSSRLLKKAGRAAALVNEVDEQITGVTFEAASNIRTIKTLAIETAMLERVKNYIKLFLVRVADRIFYFQRRNFILFLYASVFRVGCLTYILFGVINGKYEVGFFALFYTFFNTLWIQAENLAEVGQEIVVAKQQIARMRESFHDVPLTNPHETKLFPKDWTKIEVTDMSFSYGAEDVLKNISFEVKKGEKVGIVGLSGAGKSTLFKLLLKERIPTHGSVSVEGVPIDTIKNDSYLANVSVVLQDTEVFNMTLRENIEIVRSDTVSDSQALDRALTVSHVKDFLQKLPDGVETIIGEKGVKLSGGERQRLGIARAIYKNPDILLMDEATSHLDIESEKKIQASLHEFFQGVTAIVIAHRLTTIKEMDKILVIEEGKIVESGSFKELTKKKGRFYELWEKQQL
jgi:ABC-type multidrug transport system fused ATPase/permease subunit